MFTGNSSWEQSLSVSAYIEEMAEMDFNISRAQSRRQTLNHTNKAWKPFFTSVLVDDPRRDGGVGY